MAERTHIGIDNAVKTRLEQYKDTVRGCKTASDAIDDLLTHKERSNRETTEREIKELAESDRKQRQDITIGSERKDLLQTIGKELDLKNLNSVIDILMMHWNDTETISKNTMTEIIQLRR